MLSPLRRIEERLHEMKEEVVEDLKEEGENLMDQSTLLIYTF